MIKKLKIRFIIVSLISVLFVLSIAISAINITNYIRIENEAQSSLTMILDRGFNEKEEIGGPNRKPEGPEINKQHYFLVAFDEDGTIKQSDFKHIFSISEEEGKELATTALKNSSSKGTLSGLKYKKETKEATTCIAFIDVSDKMNGFNNFLVNSLIVSSISYVVLAALIVLASQIIFKTSEESYQKQKSFVTNASHELKTPLTIISTDLEIIEMDYGKNEWTSSIRDQIQRLTTMTNQLVTLSKIEESDMKNYPFEDFSLTKLAKECIEAFLPTYQSKELILKDDIAQDAHMHGNEFLINELFYIFLDNALKYAEEKGEVEVKVKNIKNHLEISFSNDIDEDNEIDTNALFERFYRSPNAKKDGSGIGLSIAKEIIDVHHGKIKVNIKDGKINFVLTF